MLDRTQHTAAALPGDWPPLLTVVIDTEEEFDWAKPLARANTSVESIAAQPKAQAIFDRYGLVPTYVIDYPVATSALAADVLGGFLREGRCEIGAHLHPWVNPPDEETVNPRNSYPGNLPPALERAKLERLTGAIEAGFDVRPRVYKAGRYGVGPATATILADLGYQVDISVVPRTEFSADGGPDFRAFGADPYWFADGRILEVPLSCGFAGLLAGWGPSLYPRLFGRLALALHAPGVAARLGLLERIRLTPEGIDPAAHRRLTESLLAQGTRVFSLTYHSPSLAPGHTPYVADAGDLERFLAALDRYLGYFMNELGGRPTTPSRLRAALTGDGAP
ncbi:MAG: polysaccharide deacetylase family protein [Kiloniellaceae bacterium]